MKKSVFIFFIMFAFVSCTEQKPKHYIYGKWVSSDKTELVFSDDNSCKLTQFGENEEVLYSVVYYYKVIDDSTVKIVVIGYDEYKLKVRGKIESDKTLHIQCSHSKGSKGEIPVDLPTICPGYYKKVEE